MARDKGICSVYALSVELVLTAHKLSNVLSSVLLVQGENSDLQAPLQLRLTAGHRLLVCKGVSPVGDPLGHLSVELW